MTGVEEREAEASEQELAQDQQTAAAEATEPAQVEAEAETRPPAEEEIQAAETVAAAPPDAELETAPPPAEVEASPPVQEETGEEVGEIAAEAVSEARAEAGPEAAAEAGEGAQDFGAVLAEHEAQQAAAAPQEAGAEGPQPGHKVRGKIVSIGEETVFVDFGAKAEGQIPIAELKDEEGTLQVAAGEEVEALLTRIDGESGAFELHARVGDWAQSLEDLKRALQLELPVEGMVTGVNKGGVEVKLAGVRAFCPLSQLELSRVEDPFPYANRRLVFRILRIEDGKKRRRPNVVLSRRALLEEGARERAKEARQSIDLGSVLQGKVTSLASYGAFVDLGGIEGLLHVSEIDHTRVGHPKEVLSEGEEVTVKVIKIEKGKGRAGRERISLSRKGLMDDPWKQAAQSFPEGESVKGKVVRLAPFGAFVELAPGVDGLVHISELDANKRISHPREAVKPGQEVEVTVLKVETGKRRISLSMKPGAAAEIGVSGSYEPTSQGSFGSLGDFFKASNLASPK